MITKRKVEGNCAEYTGVLSREVATAMCGKRGVRISGVKPYGHYWECMCKTSAKVWCPHFRGSDLTKFPLYTCACKMYSIVIKMFPIPFTVRF